MWVFPFDFKWLVKWIFSQFNLTFGTPWIELYLWHLGTFYFDLFMSSLNQWSVFNGRVDFSILVLWVKRILRHWGFDVHWVSEVLSRLNSYIVSDLFCLSLFHRNTEDTWVIALKDWGFEGVKNVFVIVGFFTLNSWNFLGLVGYFFLNALYRRYLLLYFESLLHEPRLNNLTGIKLIIWIFTDHKWTKLDR